MLLDPLAAFLRPPRPAAAIFLYGGPLAEALRRVKYGARPDLAASLGKLMASAAQPYAGRVDCVVPLPLHPARLRARGFNQAALLARPVARALGVPMRTRELRRVRPTATQASLPRGERLGNVRGAFRAKGATQLGRVLLIDDVRTTGATLASAAATLLDAGCPRVFTLALARADG